MKPKPSLSLFAIPLLVAAYVVYHPGVAFAATPLSKGHTAAHFQQSGNLTVDPMHTFIGFDIGHMGLSRVQGRFDKLTGSIVADSKDLSKCSVKVTAETDSVDTNVAPRDADLRSPNFFDVAKFPELSFVSTRIWSKGKGYVAEGDLTLKGVTKHVSIPFKQYGPIKDPFGMTRIGILAEPITVHRSDFGITFDAGMISDDVTVRISLEATLDKAQ